MTSITHAGAPVRAFKAEDVPEIDVPLEPKEAPPAPEPFKAGVGTWVGTGFGGLVGAGLGMIGGGIFGFAVNGGLSGQGYLPVVLAGIAAAGGAVAGGFIAYNMAKGSHDTAESSRIQAEHGTSTLEFARGMIHQFDHNSNGRIDLVNTTGLASQDERVYSEERRQSRSHPKYDIWNDEWRTETERWTETRGTSAAPVWDAADGAPKDQVVSDVELAKLMANYDTNRSGSLTTAEQDAFRQAHPVIVDSWQR